MIYAFAVSVGLLAAALALIVPAWLRGGRAELARQTGRIAPLLGGILVMEIALVGATARGFGQIVSTILAGLSVGVLVWWLRPGGQSPVNDAARPILIVALIISVAVLVYNVASSLGM